MKYIVALIACLISLASHAQTLSPKQFTETFATELRKTSPATKVTVKANLELLLTNAAGKESTAFLDNAYKSYQQDTTLLRDVIQRYSASYLSQDSERAVEKSRIVPIIKDKEWISEITASLKKHGASKPLDNVFEEYNDQLLIVYAEDNPSNIRYITQKDLHNLGLNKAELKPLSISNLKNAIPKIEIHKGPVVSMITAGGDYEASLLLLDDIWKDKAIQVAGEIVVAIPSRDLLLVTGTRTPGGIPRIKEIIAKSFQQAPYRLTSTLFVYRNGRFIAYQGQ